VTGWNTLGSAKAFDWMFLYKRCHALGLLEALKNTGRWGHTKFCIDEKTGGWSERARVPIVMPGRVMHDMMLWTKKNKMLREYNLNFVAESFGCGEKDDVSYNQIDSLSRTHAGRVKLAVYCELDSRLVCKLMLCKSLDPIGKSVALSAITGCPIEDLIFKGSMNSLRLCLLRVSHKHNFVLSCPSYSEPDPEPVTTDIVDDGEPSSRYQGGKVLAPVVGYYADPVVTLDFGSLYPSCMCELNICKSTQITRKYARDNALAFLQPPAPSLSGIWHCNGARVARVDEVSDSDIKVRFYDERDDFVAAYTDELNESVTTQAGERLALDDGGYALVWPSGERWERKDSDVLCFVDTRVFEGIIPLLERTLKLDRKAAKRRMAEAEAASNAILVTYFDNLQNSIKVLMNALYGGLGSGKGGIFPASAPLASAITARGRSLIVMVKKTVEARFLLQESRLLCLDTDAQAVPPEAKPLRVLYGDTDSVMILLPGCSLQTAADYGKQLSAYFGQYKLQPPHVLEFEKVLFPAAFYKKKMYAAAKYEEYGADAQPKIWARGLSAVRRDNAVIVKDTVLAVMDMLFKHRRGPDDIIGWLGRRLADVHNSAVLAHAPDAAFAGEQRFALSAFVQSAGISKELDEFDAPNAAVAVARQMLLENPHSAVGKNSRVTFVVTKAARDTKRAEQVTLPSRCESLKVPLDATFYTDAVVKKVAPMLAVLFAASERRARRAHDVFGAVVEVEPARASDKDKLLGQATAEAKIAAAFRANTLLARAPAATAAGGAALWLSPPLQPPQQPASKSSQGGGSKKRAALDTLTRAADARQPTLQLLWKASGPVTI
jgi:DNA polymerase zeta